MSGGKRGEEWGGRGVVRREGRGWERGRGLESNQVQTLSYGLAAVVECLFMGQ